MERTWVYNGHLIVKDHWGYRIGTTRFRSLKQAQAFADRMNAQGETAADVAERLTARD